ncbi:MAG: DUF3592 domain-containing protein [Labilithrix sp.]|nr:DUF3592 domain-containing protein [Labilithrix sp.]
MLTAIAFIMILVAVALGAIGVAEAIRVRRAKRWPAAVATVVAADVIDGEPTEEMHRVVVRYEYTLGEASYRDRGKRHAGEAEVGAHGSWQGARALAARYPLGCEVTVWVDPRDTSRSRIVPLDAGVAWVLLAIALAFGTVALAALRFDLR